MGSTLQGLLDTEIDSERLRPKDDDDLAKLLEQEMFLAWDYRQTQQQADGLGYYLADKIYRKYTRVSDQGTSSQMISKDVAESIDDLIPDFQRALFGGSDQIIEYEAGGPEDSAEFLREATTYINSILRGQEDFSEQAHDYIKDGLLQKLGLFEIVCLKEKVIPEFVGSVDADAIYQYANRGDVEQVILKDELGEGRFNIIVRRKIPRQFRVDSVRPEDVLLCRDADTLDQRTTDGARYVAIRKTSSVSAAIEQWPGKRDLWIKAADVTEGGLSTAITTGHGEMLQQFRECARGVTR